MFKNYTIGFPRIGEQRELKFALEAFWSGKAPFSEVEDVARTLRLRHWEYQKAAGIDLVSVNDFSLYDNMLDTAVMLGAIPQRFRDISDPTERYFAMARGTGDAFAMEMTKWFNTNYHYIVPELSRDDTYRLDSGNVIGAYQEAVTAGYNPKINLIGPLTFLGLSKKIDRGETWELFGRILPLYEQLMEEIAALGDEVVVQFDEPIFVTGVDTKIRPLIKIAYDTLAGVSDRLKVVVATYFEHSCEATATLLHTPVYGLALDFVHGPDNFKSLEKIAASDKKLIAGIVDGRNIWINDITKSIDTLTQIATFIPKERLAAGTSCSLLHVPFTLRYETEMDPEIKSWLSYAVEKLDELHLISRIFFNGVENLSTTEKSKLEANIETNLARRASTRIHDKAVLERIAALDKTKRDLPFEERIALQHAALQYRPLATTTIGSFPQTPEIRKARRDYKNGTIDNETYEAAMKAYIDDCVAFQEEIGLEVLVHGEPERNDMVEYFGEQLKGYGFSQNGWVQSYGSRCVKPPFIYGDISRPEAMTVDWITYAQSRTDKIMKGMLTGPVTILNWSFVRDDMPRSEVSRQIAVALSDEVDDLQKAGIRIIQVDEAAFKEGYPLRRENIPEYESWAVRDFKIAVSKAHPETQIHTHMCYSEFNDIIHTIEAMDADVISIETARSGNALLRIFKKHGYKQEVGPGVYDIHSPRIPSVEEIVDQIHALLEVLPAEQLWINPDCGLKTRKWEEVRPSLKNMVEAVKIVRESL
jgi:5-methyltetrahydropteroyltriglutamate--homocysteine methyltransferase